MLKYAFSRVVSTVIPCVVVRSFDALSVKLQRQKSLEWKKRRLVHGFSPNFRLVVYIFAVYVAVIVWKFDSSSAEQLNIPPRTGAGSSPLWCHKVHHNDSRVVPSGATLSLCLCDGAHCMTSPRHF